MTSVEIARSVRAAVLAGLLLFSLLPWGCRSVSVNQEAFAEQKLPAEWVTDEDRAIVREVLNRADSEDQATSRLIDLLVSDRVGVAYLAEEELKKRSLTQTHIAGLQAIVGMVPFSRQGCVLILQWPGMNVAGYHAWNVLAEAITDRKSTDEQMRWLISELRYERPFGQSRSNAAANRLAKIGAPAVPALIRALKREGTNAQLWAGRTLMQIGSDEAKAAVEEWALANLERTDDDLVWGVAADWLGRLNSRAAFEPLVRMLWAHLEEYRVCTVIYSLPKVGGPDAAEVLVEVIAEHKPDETHKELVKPYLSAGQELAKLGDSRGKQALLEAADSHLVELRREVAFSLVVALGEEARPILEKLRTDSDELVARRAEGQLRYLERRSSGATAQ